MTVVCTSDVHNYDGAEASPSDGDDQGECSEHR